MGVWCFSHLSMVCLLECITERGCCSHFAVELRSLPVHFDKKIGANMCSQCRRSVASVEIGRNHF